MSRSKSDASTPTPSSVTVHDTPVGATAIVAPPVDAAAVQRDTAPEHRPDAVLVTGNAEVPGQQVAPPASHVRIWSVLSSSRSYNVPVTLPAPNGAHAPTTRISRVTILPGENMVPAPEWQEMKNLKYYKNLLEQEMIGEGPLPKHHRKNTFDVDSKGQMMMAPANKKDIGVICPKSRDTVANHAARLAGDHLHVRMLDDAELAKAGYSSGNY